MSKFQLGLASLLVALITYVAISPTAAQAACVWKRASNGLYMDIDSAADSCLEELATEKDGAYELTKSAVWLDAGSEITSSKAANTEGEFLFENTLEDSSILCSLLLEGTVGASGADEVTKVFNLSGTELKELDEEGATGGISCTGVKTCETGSEIWPVNLPFKGQVSLATEEPQYLNTLLENGKDLLPAYYILCLVLGTSVDELCTAIAGTSGELSNAASDVEVLGAQSPATCNGNAEEGVIENNSGDVALTSLASGQTLAVSE